MCPSGSFFAPSGATGGCPNLVSLPFEQCKPGAVPPSCSEASKKIANTPGFCSTNFYAAPGADSSGCPAVPSGGSNPPLPATTAYLDHSFECVNATAPSSCSTSGSYLLRSPFCHIGSYFAPFKTDASRCPNFPTFLPTCVFRCRLRCSHRICRFARSRADIWQPMLFALLGKQLFKADYCSCLLFFPPVKMQAAAALSNPLQPQFHVRVTCRQRVCTS